MLYGYPNDDDTKLLAVQSDYAYAQTHDSVQDKWVEVPDGTMPFATSTDRGKTWTNPPPPAPAADAYVVDITTFKMRFHPQELIAVRKSTDDTVKAFLLEVVDDPRTARVNLALPFVQGAVGYLAGVVDLGGGKLAPAIIDPARVPAILAPAS